MENFAIAAAFEAFDEYNDNQHNEVARFIREKMDRKYG